MSQIQAIRFDIETAISNHHEGTVHALRNELRALKLSGAYDKLHNLRATMKQAQSVNQPKTVALMHEAIREMCRQVAC